MIPLPWFAFNISKYLSETMGLDTEGHGAYLLLILHYYATGTPPKNDDRSLAAITKLSADRWADRREDLATFFVIEDGFWRHYGIESDMREASLKHAASTAKAKAGANARWRKADPQNVDRTERRTPQASSKQSPSNNQAPGNTLGMPLASSEHASEDAHLHKQTTTPFGRSSTAEQENDDATKDHNEIRKNKSIEHPIGSPLPEDWKPNEQDRQVAHSFGMDDPTIEVEVLRFHALNAQRGTSSQNWNKTWTLWCAEFKRRKDKEAATAPPRVEVSAGFKPTPEQWDGAAKFYASTSRWSSQLGPDPMSPACRCPKDILTKHGIDPDTGCKIRTAPSMMSGHQ